MVISAINALFTLIKIQMSTLFFIILCLVYFIYYLSFRYLFPSKFFTIPYLPVPFLPVPFLPRSKLFISQKLFVQVKKLLLGKPKTLKMYVKLHNTHFMEGHICSDTI